MKTFLRWGLPLLVLAGVAGAWIVGRGPGTPIETIGLGPSSLHAGGGDPGLCPWRKPQGDMRAFFPGADRYETRTLFLSGLRMQILQKLGPGSRLNSNVLYVYPVWQARARRGAVLVDRAAGEYGVIETVVGVDPDGHVVGVRLQRYREPAAVSGAILSPRWLGAFRAKTADSALHLGKDIPAVPPAAQISAEAITRTVHALLVEDDVAERHLGFRK